MLGRAAYKTPYILSEIHSHLTGEPLLEKHSLAMKMADYADMVIENGGNLHQVTRHMLGLFSGERGAKYWRQQLGELARLQPHNSDLIRKTAKFCCAKTQRKVA
jgi:tRNA-dihydrouridine synthase A